MVATRYRDFIRNDIGGYQYTVSASPESEREMGIHASEVSGCHRRLVYGIGTERRPDPVSTDINMRMRFRLGQAVHAMLQDEFQRMCATGPLVGPGNIPFTLTFEAETHIAPHLGGAASDHGIHSSTDGIFTFWYLSEPIIRILLEIKTKSGPEFDKLKTPAVDHIEQSHVYMGTLNVPMTWLLYYNKSNSNFTDPEPPFLFRFNDKLWSDLEMRFLRSNHMAETNNLPPRTEGIHCRWCPFAYTCNPEFLTRFSSAPPVSSSVASRRLGVRKR